MGHIVKLVDGHMVYDGLLSSKEKASIDDILHALQEEIPTIEADMKAEYGQGVWYKYNLGLFLGSLLEKYEISVSERRRFWDEIKHFATKEERKRDEGANSVTRSFYQQCYILSQQDKDVVEKLTWRQWQDILDRVGNREDERIFQWLKRFTKKIREDDWREFEKALNLYLKGKDTSVFETEELFEIYDSIMLMSVKWREQFKVFSTEHPKSAKIKSKGKWSKKYYALCFNKKKEQHSQVVTEEMCYEAFTALM
ncbi:ATP-dependent helicase [Lachnospiraceae bacterium BSM-380-WT-5A]|uniref:ATP-dependent helicase n=1 Tax=Oliverpabstia intestinalis TaxID=2606633 RepID=A0A7X2P4X3_9FIRM|nr:ATP-dependent helicase [Oliverpabstia intestinalis]MST67575.1 ATP-dependent helicase [Oliverpabstia intestinalis]